MKRIAILTLALGLAACGSTPEPVTRSAAPLSSEAPDPSPLASYDIPRGRCGMILWTKTGGTITPIFRSLDVTTATMTVDGEAIEMILQEQSGEFRLGMRQNQVFAPTGAENAGLEVSVRINWGSGFPAGTYVESGTLTLNGADGWGRVLPVAGIAGCKT